MYISNEQHWSKTQDCSNMCTFLCRKLGSADAQQNVKSGLSTYKCTSYRYKPRQSSSTLTCNFNDCTSVFSFLKLKLKFSYSSLSQPQQSTEKLSTTPKLISGTLVRPLLSQLCQLCCPRNPLTFCTVVSAQIAIMLHKMIDLVHTLPGRHRLPWYKTKLASTNSCCLRLLRLDMSVIKSRFPRIGILEPTG